MIDMILLGCCVSGAGCVFLADWPASTGSRSCHSPRLYLSIVINCARSVHRFSKKRFDSPLDKFALLFGHKKGLTNNYV